MTKCSTHIAQTPNCMQGIIYKLHRTGNFINEEVKVYPLGTTIKIKPHHIASAALLKFKKPRRGLYQGMSHAFDR